MAAAFTLMEAGELHPVLLTFPSEMETAYTQHSGVVVHAQSGKSQRRKN